VLPALAIAAALSAGPAWLGLVLALRHRHPEPVQSEQQLAA